MTFAAILVCVGCLPQLQVKPYPAEVGEVVVMRAGPKDAPLAALPVQVELPDGSVIAAGSTDAAGEVRFLPQEAGQHVFVATIGGVRTLAPLAVRKARARWPLAIATVPLGLALLWWNLSRARGRRAP